MAQILIDANGFQALADFETGKAMDEPLTQRMKDLMKITPSIPFPGDESPEAVKWTIDAALKIDDYMHPDFMFISIASPMLLRTFCEMSDEESKALYDNMFQEINRFFAETKYEAVVVGGGSLSPVIGGIDLSPITKKPVHSTFNHSFAGIYETTEEESAKLREIEHIQKIISREEYVAANPRLSAEYIEMLPDYMIMREDGYAFNTIAKRGYKVRMVADSCSELPVYTTLGEPKHIRDIYPMINKALDEGKRVAIVLLEATGEKEFGLPYIKVDNCEDFYCYEQGVSLYRVLNSGRKYSEEADPPVVQKHTTGPVHKYPYSMINDKVSTGNLGQRPDKLTASVGTRSGFTHSYCLCDVNVECHSRNLAGSAVLVMVNDEKNP